MHTHILTDIQTHTQKWHTHADTTHICAHTTYATFALHQQTHVQYFLHTHKHTYIHVHTNMQVHTHVCTCMCAHIHMCMCAHIRMQTAITSTSGMHASKLIFIYILHTHTLTHSHTHAHTHTHTNRQT